MRISSLIVRVICDDGIKRIVEIPLSRLGDDLLLRLTDHAADAVEYYFHGRNPYSESVYPHETIYYGE